MMNADKSQPCCLYYLFISAIIGAIVLGMEVLTARMMAPSVGSGPVPWACLLSVALGSIAAGNLIGGIVVERTSASTGVSWTFIVASAALICFSQACRPVMTWLAGMSLFTASLAAAFISQAIPMFVLGMTTPLILQTVECKWRKGMWPGMVLAFGSLGGIAGALLAGIWILPYLGLSRSYLLLGCILIVAGFPLTFCRRQWLALALLLVLLLIAACCWIHSSEPNVIQSRYGQLEVRVTPYGPALLSDGIQQTALVPGYDSWDSLKHGYLLEVALIFKPRIETALVVGLGAGLAPQILYKHKIECECVEIDPKVVEMARKPFGFSGRVSINDGRKYLQVTDRKWDLVFLDVCTSDRLPWHLFTIEAFDLVRSRVSPEGLVVILFIGDDKKWTAAVARTAQTIFHDVLFVDPIKPHDPVEPCWLFAGSNLSSHAMAADLLRQYGLKAIRVAKDRGTEDGPILTDDRFASELDWARTAFEWRQICLARR